MRQQQREFDSSAEAAGAPVECSEPSYTPRVLRRTDRALFGTVTTPDGIEYAQEWAPNGHARGLMERRGPSPRDLVMVPLDWVEGKPVYHGDVVYQGRRKIAVNASQSEAVTGRVPPWAGATLASAEPQQEQAAKPQPVVQTNMSGDELWKLYEPVPDTESLRFFANTAIARAIADGQVVPTPAEPGCTQRLKQLVAAINAVSDHSPRIRLEQVAAHMQQECVMQLLEQGEALGWMGRDKAADIVRRIDINPVVDKVMGVNREL